MQHQYRGPLEPGLDLCDVDGNKVGTVAHVYRYDLAVAGSVGADHPPSREELLPREEVVEVKTGLLGLGPPLYVPMSAIQGVGAGGVFLARRKDDFESLGWHEGPG